MAQNNPTIKLPTDGGKNTIDNYTKSDLRRSVRKNQVMKPKRSTVLTPVQKLLLCRLHHFPIGAYAFYS
jgi:hypothetical protein